ncbi:MAG: sugar transferase [Anaerolineae bacterium]|nr:sugar transferase [Anaerolineae bacterium]
MNRNQAPLPTISTTEHKLPRRTRHRLLVITLLLGDSAALAAAFALAYILRFQTLAYSAGYSPIYYATLVAVAIPAWLLLFAAFRLYDRQLLLGGTQEYANAVSACAAGTMLVIIIGFFRRDQFSVSRGWLIIAWLLSTLFVGSARFLLRRVIYALRRRGYFLAPTLIVGVNEEGLALAEQLQGWATSGLRLLGFVDDNKVPGTHLLNGLRVLGGIADLEELVPRYAIGELVIATTALSRQQLLDIFQTFGASPQVNLRLSSGLFEVITTGVQVKEMGYVPLMSLNRARLTGIDVLLKAILDYAIALPGLLLISPLLLLIALAVRFDSPGPILYRRRVMGLGGRQFDALKFRTMFVNSDEILAAHPELKAQLENNHKLKDDPRVTRVGRFLRRWSLDELPQLLNVLKRDMSLVGPRMISPPEMAEYGKWGMNLLTVRPGITGLWQVSGRSDVSYEERVRLDMRYIRNYTIWLDIQLLFQTIPAVLRGVGAY